MLGAGAVTGLTTGVITIYDRLNKPASDLRADVVASPFELPPGRVRALAGELRLDGSDPASRLDSFDGYFQISISNNGTLPAKNVSLALPAHFDVVSFVDGAGKAQILRLPTRLDIGTVRPKESITVHAWSVIPLDLYDPTRVSERSALTHDEGMGEVVASAGPIAERVAQAATPPRRQEALLGVIALLAGVLAASTSWKSTNSQAIGRRRQMN